jgi:hypothetical protein
MDRDSSFIYQRLPIGVASYALLFYLLLTDIEGSYTGWQTCHGRFPPYTVECFCLYVLVTSPIKACIMFPLGSLHQYSDV